jgi:hypothetical protein
LVSYDDGTEPTDGAEHTPGQPADVAVARAFLSLSDLSGSPMQDHSYSFEVDASPQEIWTLFWGRRSRVVEHGDVRIEYLHWGDETGEGRIRHCHFRVPRYLLSRGVGRSWEWLTEVKPYESWRYDAIGKPLWSRATGWTRLEDLGGGRTRVHFRETYEAFNPILRALLERRVHRFISKDNDRMMKSAIETGVAAMRAARQRAGQPGSLTPTSV